MSNIHLTQNANNTTSNLQHQKVELAQNEIKALGKSGLSEAEKSKKLREQCEGFESIFIQKMWQQMRATLPQENPLVGREEKFWQSMYDQELSKKMAEGGGIGLADMMYEQLSQNLVSASRTTASSANHNSAGLALNNNRAANNTASSTDSKGFVIQPAPFLASPLADLDKQNKNSEKQAQNPVSQNLHADASTHVNAPLYEEINTDNVNNAQKGQQNPQQYFVNPAQAGQATQQAQATANNPKVHTQIISGNGQNNNKALEAFLANAQQNPQAMAQAHPQNSAVVQQFLTGLQQKGQQGNMLTPQATSATNANSQPVSHVQGAPIITAAQNHGMQNPVVRTTYTTNIPKNQRNGDTERLVRQTLTHNMNQNAMTQPAQSAQHALAAQQQALALAQSIVQPQGQQQEVKNITVMPYNTSPQAQSTEQPVALPYTNPSATPAPQPANATTQDMGLSEHFMPPQNTTTPSGMMNPSGMVNPQPPLQIPHEQKG